MKSKLNESRFESVRFYTQKEKEGLEGWGSPVPDKGTLIIGHEIRYHGKKQNIRIHPSEIEHIEMNLFDIWMNPKYIEIKTKKSIIIFRGKGLGHSARDKNTEQIFRTLKDRERIWRAFPDLEVEVENIELRPEKWTREDIIISNLGNHDAFNIRIRSEGGTEIRQDSAIDILKAGENRVNKVYMKGKTTRENSSLDLKIIYQNQVGFEKSIDKTVWVRRSKKVKTAQKKSKTIEEISKDRKAYNSLSDIKKTISQLKEDERMIDTRGIDSALDEGDVKKAGELLSGLEEKYREYKETIVELETLDDKKSSLAQKLADYEIDKNTYYDAVQSIEHKKADLEERLNKLRHEVIYEDYQKPF